jgi:hypothetical protein
MKDACKSSGSLRSCECRSGEAKRCFVQALLSAHTSLEWRRARSAGSWRRREPNSSLISALLRCPSLHLLPLRIPALPHLLDSRQQQQRKNDWERQPHVSPTPAAWEDQRSTIHPNCIGLNERAALALWEEHLSCLSTSGEEGQKNLPPGSRSARRSRSASQCICCFRVFVWWYVISNEIELWANTPPAAGSPTTVTSHLHTFLSQRTLHGRLSVLVAGSWHGATGESARTDDITGSEVPQPTAKETILNEAETEDGDSECGEMRRGGRD